jgi:hypothetical protein
MAVTSSLPLNKFRLITTSLTSGSNIIYQEDLDVSTIILSAQVTNVAATTKRVTVGIIKSGYTGNTITLLNNAAIPTEESLNPFGGKLVLERNDKLVMTTNESGVLDVILSVLENANN